MVKREREKEKEKENTYLGSLLKGLTKNREGKGDVCVMEIE